MVVEMTDMHCSTLSWCSESEVRGVSLRVIVVSVKDATTGRRTKTGTTRAGENATWLLTQNTRPGHRDRLAMSAYYTKVIVSPRRPCIQAVALVFGFPEG